MSHFKVLVIGDDFEKQLAPYDENIEVESYDDDGEMTTYNPKSKWDWYSVGGRYMGSLLAKQGAIVATGRPGTFDNSSRHDGGVDQVRIKDIDWDAMRRAQRLLAEKTHAEFLAEYAKKPDWACIVYGLDTTEEVQMALDDPERWINQNSAALTCYAVVKDGEWHEKGRMGWFGMASDEMTDLQWQQRLSELLASLDGETLLTVVDCHI